MSEETNDLREQVDQALAFHALSTPAEIRECVFAWVVDAVKAEPNPFDDPVGRWHPYYEAGAERMRTAVLARLGADQPGEQ